MTAVCISSTRGVTLYKAASYTLATSAPTASTDFEVRYNLLDQNSVAITKKDLIKFLEAVIVGIQSGGPLAGQFFQSAVNGADYVGPQI